MPLERLGDADKCSHHQSATVMPATVLMMFARLLSPVSIATLAQCLLFSPQHDWLELTTFPESELAPLSELEGHLDNNLKSQAAACYNFADEIKEANERMPFIKRCIQLDVTYNQAIIELAFIYEEFADLARTASIFEHVSAV